MNRFAILGSVVLLAALASTVVGQEPLPSPPEEPRPWMPRKSATVPDPGPCHARWLPWMPPVPHMCAPHGIRRHPIPWMVCYPGDPWVDTYNPKPIAWLPPVLFGCRASDQCPTFFPGLIRRATPALDGSEALTDGR